eukprot:3458209-Pyramimonas_sp.AAC.1
MQQPNAPDASGLSSDLCSSPTARATCAGASDVSESIPVIASPASPLQPELSAENRQHLSG